MHWHAAVWTQKQWPCVEVGSSQARGWQSPVCVPSRFLNIPFGAILLQMVHEAFEQEIENINQAVHEAFKQERAELDLQVGQTVQEAVQEVRAEDINQRTRWFGTAGQMSGVLPVQGGQTETP